MFNAGMNTQNHVVLIKDFCRRQWVVEPVKEVLKSGTIYQNPLEMVETNDTDSVSALTYIANEMNRGKKPEVFWLKYAKMKTTTGKRLDYARSLVG